MCFDNWIDAEELALILGITEEIEEEYRSQQISNDPLPLNEMLKTGNELFDADDDEY